MHPVLLRIGSFVVPSYTALVDLGLLGGAVLTYLETQRRRLDVGQVLDAALVAALAAIAAARAVYVAANWAYFQDHVHRAFRLWKGGLAWHGALVGGLVAVALYCAGRRISLSITLDVLTPAAALLAICVWLGCLMVGCAYGVETYPGQGMLWRLSLDIPDLYGIRAPRVAVQLLGAGWSAIVFAAVVAAARRTQQEGLIFPMWLALYCIGSVGLGFARADETLCVAGWRIDQIVDLALAAIGLTTLLASGLGDRRSEGKPGASCP